MPLTDLGRSLPGVLVFGLLPGLALATLLAPRWSAWLRLVAAPGLSAGLLGVLGLAAHDLHLPFRPWWVGLVVAILAAGAIARAGLSRRLAPPLLTHAPQMFALACGAVVAGTLVTAMRDQPLPIDSDPAIHAAVAERIAATGDILPVIPNPIEHSAAVRPRAGAEAVAAFAPTLGAPSPTAALLPAGLLGVLLAPLGVCLLALDLTRSRAIAALAPALAAGFPYPALPLAFGELPLIADSTLVVPLVIAALRVVRGRDRRSNAAMMVAAVAAIWAVHGTEVLTAAVIAAPLAVFLLVRPSARVESADEDGGGLASAEWLRGVGVALAACAAGALMVTLLTRLPAVPAALPAAGTGPLVPEPSTVGGGSNLASFTREFFDFVLPSRVLLALYVLGVVAAWKRASLRGVLVAHLLFAALLADVTTHRVLLSLYEKVFPWSEPDRLASDQYWVLPLILAAGAVYAATQVSHALQTRVSATLPPLAAGVAGVAVAAAAVATGHDHDARFFANATRAVGMVAPSDLTVMRSMAAQLPPGTPVMVDGIDDAGQWLVALTPDLPLMGKDYVISHPRDTRVPAIAHACRDPQAAREALSGAGAVFVGSRFRVDAHQRWRADCVARIPGVRLIAQSGDSAAFAVEP